MSSAPSFIVQNNAASDWCDLRIEGPRIVLRAIAEQDAPDIFAEFTAEITRYMVPKPADTLAETLTFIRDALTGMQKKADLVLVIVGPNNEFLGCCGCHPTSNPHTPEFGIWLKKAAHGQRYGREAIATLAAWAVNHLEFESVLYPVDRANIASRKIPESLGGFVDAEKQVTAMTGHILNEVVYKIPYEVLKQRVNYRSRSQT